MAGRQIKLGELVRGSKAQQAEAREKILKAYDATGAHFLHTAEKLKVSEATYWRYINALALQEDLAKIEARVKREGRHHGSLGGRPPWKDAPTPNDRARRSRKVA